MAQAIMHEPVPFFVAVITVDDGLWELVSAKLTRIWGKISFTSKKMQFDQFTNYYEPEMGRNLIRFWAAFEQLRSPEELVQIKWSCTGLENTFAINGKRRINLDPGYLTEAKIILASFKDFSHRIYIGQGVYADMQLIYRGGRFVTMDWTFADYRSDVAQEFFLQLRKRYRAKLKSYIESDSGAISIGQESD